MITNHRDLCFSFNHSETVLCKKTTTKNGKNIYTPGGEVACQIMPIFNSSKILKQREQNNCILARKMQVSRECCACCQRKHHSGYVFQKYKVTSHSLPEGFKTCIKIVQLRCWLLPAVILAFRSPGAASGCFNNSGVTAEAGTAASPAVHPGNSAFVFPGRDTFITRRTLVE